LNINARNAILNTKYFISLHCIWKKYPVQIAIQKEIKNYYPLLALQWEKQITFPALPVRAEIVISHLLQVAVPAACAV
jgi:hypothetical protein